MARHHRESNACRPRLSELSYKFDLFPMTHYSLPSVLDERVLTASPECESLGNAGSTLNVSGHRPAHCLHLRTSAGSRSGMKVARLKETNALLKSSKPGTLSLVITEAQTLPSSKLKDSRGQPSPAASYRVAEDSQ